MGAAAAAGVPTPRLLIRKKQRYRIVDANSGLIESGYVNVEDMLSRQPWPEPGDEFAVPVTKQNAAP